MQFDFMPLIVGIKLCGQSKVFSSTSMFFSSYFYEMFKLFRIELEPLTARLS